MNTTPDKITRAGLGAILATIVGVAACGDGAVAPTSARDTVRDRIDALAPAANLGHRGTGVSVPGNPLPENSISAFREAIVRGANGVELDAELTSDGQLVVMHDDTLDRTTTCEGCVSAFTLAEIQRCRLLDGDGRPTDEIPPTLSEAYAAIPSEALVNVELKAFGSDCLTATTGPDDLARAAVAEVRSLSAAGRTLFSSFDEEAAETVRAEGDLYSALLLSVGSSTAQTWPDGLARAIAIDQDAIHPFFIIPPEGIAAALDAGLQANVWTVDRPEDMDAALDAGATAIITDLPGVLARVIESRR